MKKVAIETASKTYDVIIGNHLTESISSFLIEKGYRDRKIWIIADEAVYHLHGMVLVKNLKKTFDVTVHLAPSGERAKTLEEFERAMTHGLTNGVDRSSVVIALGGGAIGDMGGFVASTFMRGIPFIGVPTTILAHDSSVGGKVAINHPLGKNMIGQFHQPEAVFFDLDHLKSLPEREVLSGFGEVIKHAFLSGEDFLQDIKNSFRGPGSLNDAFLEECLERGIKVKADIVARDERESSVRAYLNFGHTYGHAVESASGYGNRTHGECVVVGMIYALYLSRRMSGMTFDVEGFAHWAASLGYDLTIPEELSFADLYALMTRDKKAKNGEPQFVLLRNIGEPYLTRVSKEDLEEADTFIRTINR
ncbi:3-dehydroquinate synthase [Rossellomorea marisflavi]|uniref:3-dehydroquinate synthase n=1 Tax=Rossellomorea marisflavi TaxID=189381 RepID=UPI0027981EEC|nr:3-dehydroquinate synthase [Rossellomorea marisflavi]UTE74564.1 3-dehydroquinate synthase [Rossellomorea marisflavi]